MYIYIKPCWYLVIHFFNEEVKANWSQEMHKKVKHQLTFINRICGC